MTPFPPNLTPAQLHAIVEGVPTEVRPGLAFQSDLKLWAGRFGDVHHNDAALAFIGSMVGRWIERGGTLALGPNGLPAASRGIYVYTAPTLIEALAAACREVKGTPND